MTQRTFLRRAVRGIVLVTFASVAAAAVLAQDDEITGEMDYGMGVAPFTGKRAKK